MKATTGDSLTAAGDRGSGSGDRGSEVGDPGLGILGLLPAWTCNGGGRSQEFNEPAASLPETDPRSPTPDPRSLMMRRALDTGLRPCRQSLAEHRRRGAADRPPAWRPWIPGVARAPGGA